jgi:hypothetical protein
MSCHRSHGRLQNKIQSLRTTMLQDGGALLRSILPAQRVEQAILEAGLVYRQCLFTPLLTLWTFVMQALSADGSCREAVSKMLALVAASKESDAAFNPQTGPYCKARKRLPVHLVTRLARETGQALHAEYGAGKLLGGRVIKVADGTTASMPDTPANQRKWPQPPTQKPGLGFPLVRLVAVMSLRCGAVLDVAFGPYSGKQTGETAMLRTLFSSLDPGDVLLADRYYASYWMIALLQQKSVDSLFRQHHKRKIDFRTGKRLGHEDHLIKMQKPPCPKWMRRSVYRRLPRELSVRELRVRVWQRGFRVRSLVLVTTLLDPKQYPKEQIAQAFRQRWQMELDLRSIKQTMGMSVLRCKTPQMVHKEIWIYLLAYNLIRTLMAQAAKRRGIEPREVSFAGAVQTINSFAPLLEMAGRDECQQLLEVLLEMTAAHRVGNRPDRYEPRAVKRRAKPIALLTEPRKQAREKIAKVGATK